MMVLAAHLAGLETVKEAMDDELVFNFMKTGVFDEIIPTLDLPKDELIQFANDVRAFPESYHQALFAQHSFEFSIKVSGQSAAVSS